MLIGYTRVSTIEQNFDLQLDALAKAGCTKIFQDTASGANANRKGLSEALEYAREGDTLVVWRLDRLGRSLTQLIDFMNSLKNYGVSFRSLIESIDTTVSRPDPFRSSPFRYVHQFSVEQTDGIVSTLARPITE